LAYANHASVARPKLQSDMPSAKRVLLVDDDAVLRASLVEQLTREGPYCVIEAASAAQARDLARQGRYALAIVDQDLPDGAGDALARELRAQGFDAPILLLAERDAPPPAAEHIEKPFRFADLLARLNLHLSRHAASDDLPVAIGPGKAGGKEDLQPWTGCAIAHEGLFYHFYTMRSSREDEETGLDVPETGTVAYPDFEIAHTL